MKIKIVKINGEKIGWKEAVLRNIFNLISPTLHIIVLSKALLNFGLFSKAKTPIEFISTFSYPGHLVFFDYLIMLWVAADFTVFFLSEKRRSLKDFVAGTVAVIDD